MGSSQPATTIANLMRDLLYGSLLERAAATTALSHYGEQALQPLLLALRDPSPLVAEARPRIIEALGAVGDARALPALMAELRSSRADVRQASARALGALGNPVAIPALIDLFRQDERVGGDEAGVVGVWEEAATALAAFGEPALGPLCAALRDPSENVRAWSVVTLGRLRDAQALNLLLRALADRAPQVRAYAAEALSTFADASTFAPLASMSRLDPDPFARSRAAYALAAYPGAQTVDALLPALRDSDVTVRCAAAYAIGCSGDRRATGILISLLSDRASEVREAAVLRLGEIGDERVAQTLEPLTLDHTSADGVRVFAQAAVERIRGRS